MTRAHALGVEFGDQFDREEAQIGLRRSLNLGLRVVARVPVAGVALVSHFQHTKAYRERATGVLST